MKEICNQLASYNVWANQKMIDVIAALPLEIQQKTIASSFAGLYLTLLHLWNTESAWWQRIKLAETVQLPGNTDMQIHEITAGLINQSKQWEEWIAKSTTVALEHVFAYQNSKKEQFKQPVYQVLIHLFNHATYHRGQLVTILRQLGIETIPATDFIAWSRNKK